MFESLKKMLGRKSKSSDHRSEEEVTEKNKVSVSVQTSFDSQVTAPVTPRVGQRSTRSQRPTESGQKAESIKTQAGKSESSASARKVAPRVQRNVEKGSGRRAQKSSVYIGLDFGTTFTKAAFEIAPSNVHMKYSIKFGPKDTYEDYYLPSVVYFDPTNANLSMFKSTRSHVEIRYFKYSIISDALQKNKVINDTKFFTHTPKEQLCCVFFLGYVIHKIREEVKKNFNAIVNEDTSWYINMGVPLEASKDNTRALLYKRILEIAYLFEQEYHGQTEIGLRELDDFFVEHEDESNPHMNTLPEIYAEVLLYQQYLNTPAGFYTVVDIGGGTEDIATFLKTNDEFGEKVECLAQNVIGYGYESISEKIVYSITKASVKSAKDFMNLRIDFNDEYDLRRSLPAEVNFDSLMDARKQCRTLFGSCVQRARRTREDILQETVSAELPMHVFIMGGARGVEFYRSSIEYMKKAQKNAGIPFFKDDDVFDYVGNNTRLEIRNDQRLVISQMLAQPYEMIPEIDKMPWELKEQDITSKAMSWLDLFEKVNELYPK